MLTFCSVFMRRAGGACLALVTLTACSKRRDTAAADSTGNASAMADAASTIPFDASINCTRAASDVEKLVCSDPDLGALDQKLGGVYREAEAKQGPPVPAWFTDEQRDWNTRRDACGSSGSPKACVDSAYTRRIAALQATSLLVPTRGPVIYSCPLNGDHGEVVAMFADTDPPTVVLERGDRSVVAYFVKSPGGPRYEGTNVTFQDRSGEVQLLWLGTALTCREQAASS